MDATVIRRTVTIPIVVNEDNILALAEVGGKLWSKELIYQMFFEHGAPLVRAAILKEIKKRGGSEKDFKSMIESAKKKFAS
jgi:hypothetical protein